MSPASNPEPSARPRRRRRLLVGSLTAVLALVLAAGVAVLYQNNYDLREENVTITGGVQPLQGVLAVPTTGHGPYGLVVFIHGDGPIDATHDTFYRPMWESFARAGYASLSWDKPGVNGAPGDWLDQSMQDRAEETMAAITWARTRPGIDRDRIGLWGASQAGWVLPTVAARMPDLQFVIAVSPAINWLRQGRYNLLAELRAEHASEAKIRDETAASDAFVRQLRNGATFEQAQATGKEARGLTRGRWRFAAKNYTADASADLAATHVPVLLILAGHDLNVDVADTETTSAGS